MAPGVLVVGYGNMLRGDDAVGRLVAEEVALWNRPGVSVVSLTQLLPELADRVSASRAVIFVDACDDEAIDGIRIQEITGTAATSGHTHFAAPITILQLAQSCYGRAPRAWLVAVGARNFELTNQVSPAARANAAAALDAIAKLLDSELTATHSQQAVESQRQPCGKSH